MYRSLQRHRLGRVDRPPAAAAFIASLVAREEADGFVSVGAWLLSAHLG